MAGPPNRAVFPHWLDPEYMISNQISDPNAYQIPIRLSFLYGEHLVISDIQAWDGPVIASCFADPDFRILVRDHPQLLGLAVGRDPEKDPQGDFDLYAALSGARRCTSTSKWRSSVFGDNPYQVQRFAEHLIRHGRNGLHEASVAEFLKVHSDLDEATQNHLRAIHFAVCHFADEERANVYPIDGVPTTYLQAAEELLDVETDGHALKALGRLVEFIHQHDEEEGIHYSRSVLYRVLAQALTDDEIDLSDRNRLWATAVHSYNRATQSSLGVNCGSAGRVGDVPITGSATSEVVRLVGRHRELASSLASCDDVPHALPLATMPWSHVRYLFFKTSESRQRLEKARREGDIEAIQDAAREHATKLGEEHGRMESDPTQPRLGVGTTYSLLEGTAGQLIGLGGAAAGGAALAVVPYASFLLGPIIAATREVRQLARRRRAQEIMVAFKTFYRETQESYCEKLQG